MLLSSDDASAPRRIWSNPSRCSFNASSVSFGLCFLTGRELSCMWITVTIYIHCTRTISCFMDDFFLFLLRKWSMVLNQGLMPRLYPGVLGGSSRLSCYEGSTGIGIEAGEAGRHPTTLGSPLQHGVIQSKMLIVQLRHPVFNYKLPEGWNHTSYSFCSPEYSALR